MSDTFVHRAAVDRFTICCQPVENVSVADALDADAVTCPVCSYHATKSSDPAHALLVDDFTTSTTVYNGSCYICRDPEFAMMGMPLCYPCPTCKAHTPADDTVCDNGHDTYPIEAQMADGVPQITDVPTGDFL